MQIDWTLGYRRKNGKGADQRAFEGLGRGVLGAALAREKRVSRNSPTFAVALNCGIRSSSLKADVNALERLQIVSGRNSSYFSSKYRSCTVRTRCFGASSFPSAKDS